MINQLLRLTFLTYIWKRYKTAIVSAVLLLLFFWVIGTLHQDYIQYAELNDDKAYLALSFLIKWLFYISGLACFGYINWRVMGKQAPSEEQGLPPVSESIKSPPAAEGDAPVDPFDAIRRKERLQSKADKLISKKPQR